MDANRDIPPGIPKIYHFECIDSTQSESARILAQFSAHSPGILFAVTAEKQNCGKGRFNRIWQSPYGQSSLSTMVVRIPKTAQQQILWTSALCALAVQDAVEELFPEISAQTRLKWPNDLLLPQGRSQGKFCGILVQVINSHTPELQENYLDVACGIGVNTTMTKASLPEKNASSLHIALGAPHPNCKTPIVRKAVIQAQSRRLKQWQAANWDTQKAGIISEYQKRCHTIGKEITATIMTSHKPKRITGIMRQINKDGSALLENEQGTHVISAADITLREGVS